MKNDFTQRWATVEVSSLGQGLRKAEGKGDCVEGKLTATAALTKTTRGKTLKICK